VKSKLYVEGGGDSKELHTRCRSGFNRLLVAAGLGGRMPRIVACGGRADTFRDFVIAHKAGDVAFVAMLIDSETPVADLEQPWYHLHARDGWEKPAAATNDQALLMVTSMESWIAADEKNVSDRFGKNFRSTALPAMATLEAKSPEAVLQALRSATKDCAANYEKGGLSFEVLGLVSPATLENLPSFKRVKRILEARL
jgi:hypothetical protein